MFGKSMGAVLVFTMAVLSASAARADEIKHKPLSLNGVLLGISKDAILVRSGKSKIKVDFVAPGKKGYSVGSTIYSGVEPTFKVKGEFDGDVLKKGMYVRFTATLDVKSGEAQGEVAEFTLIRPSKEQRLGTIADGATDGETGGFLVAGRIKSLRSITRKMTVEVPKGPGARRGQVKLTIAESAVVKLESDSLADARKGDQVNVNGMKFSNGQALGLRFMFTRHARRKGDDPPPAIAKGPDKDKKKDPFDTDAGSDDKGKKKPADKDGKADEAATGGDEFLDDDDRGDDKNKDKDKDKKDDAPDEGDEFLADDDADDDKPADDANKEKPKKSRRKLREAAGEDRDH